MPLKMHRLKQWCEDINQAQSDIIYDFLYVDEESFDKYKPSDFGEIFKTFEDYK